MKLTTIGSSSRGNAYVLQNDKEALIIEAGIALKQVKIALDFNTEKVMGCIVSHTHNDHAGYAKEYEDAGITLLALPEVIEAKSLKHAVTITPKQGYKMGGFRILPFPVLHDVPCCGFLIQHDESGKLVFATDTYAIQHSFKNVNYWMLEANYDDMILETNIEHGRTPAAMRSRLLTSHMSLDNTIKYLKKNDLSHTQGVILIHLSDGNSNEKDFVKRTRMATGKRVQAAKKGITIDLNIIKKWKSI